MKTRIIHLGETDSTNRYLLALAAEDRNSDCDDVVVATADYQTAGRGMGSNTWESEDGKNLLFSMLIHPVSIPPRWQYLLSMTEALAIREAVATMLETAGFGDEARDITIKWPNDIYWRNRKLSGTRIDLNISSQGIRDLVMGTGINVNQREFHSDAPNPVSLQQITGQEIPIQALLDDIMRSFEHYYGHLCNGGLDDIVDLYHQHLYRRTGLHLYEDANGEFRAETVEVRRDGILVLRREDGTLSEYEFKEVKFKGLNG